MTKGDFAVAETKLDASHIPNYMKTILFVYKRTYCKGYSINSVNESTAAMVPFLQHYFPNSKRYTAFGPDKHILESKTRFTEMDPSLSQHVRKADFSIVTNQTRHLVLAVESKSDSNKYGSKADLIKMAKYMKDTLDSIESEGFKTVVIAGIIVSGVDCSCYLMQHQSDDIYTLYKLDSFFIPVNYRDMCRIQPILPIINQMKKIIQDTVSELTTLEMKEARQ